MARREPLTVEQRRLLRVAARMPLATAANLASALGMAEDRTRSMLGVLLGSGLVASVRRGMTERQQHRWFLTGKAWTCCTSPATSTPTPGRRPGPGAWRSSTRRVSFRRISGRLSRWTTTTRSTWKTRRLPPSPPVSR